MIYLHRDKLEEVNAELARIVAAGEILPFFEARGLCSSALCGIADDTAEEAVAAVIAGAVADTSALSEAFFNAYVSGIAIGLLAAERVGR